ncbi:MAG: hypothetical protein HY791_33690 [Deltaproteobacteria bacterium]|nr:hypothetical protein [Deltaproteobacteria bacterium]
MRRRLGALPVIMGLGLSCGGDQTVDPPSDVPTGALSVAWTVVDPTGSLIDCREAGFGSVEVAIGGEPRVVGCDESPQRFERLLPERYPVFARLQIEGVEVLEERTNATVESGKETQVQLRFEFAGVASGLGSIRVRWVIEGDSPSRGCDLIGAQTMSLTSGPASRASFDASAPCVDGEAEVTELPPGVYEVIARLFDDRGSVVATNSIPTVVVEAEARAEPPTLDLFSPTFEGGSLLATWTANGTTAAAGCVALGGRSVRARVVQRLDTATSTSCATGRLLLPRLRPAGDLSVSLLVLGPVDPITLIEPVVTSTIVEHLQIEVGRTTTVSVDFRAAE